MQAAICVGYITPLFISYVIEARHKLRFARRHGLLRRDQFREGLGMDSLLISLRIDDSFVLALFYVNVVLLTNMVVMIAILRFHSQ